MKPNYLIGRSFAPEHCYGKRKPLILLAYAHKASQNAAAKSPPSGLFHAYKQLIVAVQISIADGLIVVRQ